MCKSLACQWGFRLPRPSGHLQVFLRFRTLATPRPTLIMSEQSNVHDLHEPIDYPQNPPLEGGHITGSLHDRTDMQRLGKQQELKVRSPRSLTGT